MLLAKPHRRPYWQTLLRLGRVSNLPTVWSNCLAAWLLGGGGGWMTFLWVLLGASCVYVGGMFLNDAFDVEFDQAHRRERPIPSGQITIVEVWRWGFGWIAAGMVLLVPLGKGPALFALLLIGAIVVYNAIHKLIAFAPLLMALCRVLLYLLAASAAVDGVTGLTLWCALAMGVYITGLSYFAVHESAKRGVPWWPAALLFCPVLLALLINTGDWRLRGFLFSLLAGIWILHCLQRAYRPFSPNVGAAISGLLAGIVLIDLLAVAGGDSLWMTMTFLSLFGLALAGQRFIPAN
jgi:4-hydroxybenzoate polyprenyltransferase